MAANYTVSTKFNVTGNMSAKLAGMQKSVNRFSQKAIAGLSRVELSFRRVERRIGGMLGKLGKLGLGFGALMIAQQIATAQVDLDQSMASLQAITGATNTEMVMYADTLEKVSKSQKIFGADTAKVFELVGSAKPELLKSAEALGKVSEQAIILSKAGKLEITDSVKALTGSLNQFGKGAEFAAQFTDILATAQQKGSGNIEYLSQAMVNAGGTSRAFGNSFHETVAILEGFSKAGVPASEAGTQLAGILAKLSTVQKKEFNPQFTKATDIIKNLSDANLSYTDLIKLTDVRGAKWLTTIINQNDEVQRLTGNLNEVGNAQAQANIQTRTLGKLWKEVVDQFKNATTTTDQSNKKLNDAKNILAFVSANMEKLIAIAIKGIKAFLIYKAVMISLVVAQKAFVAVMAIAKFARFVTVILAIAKAKGVWAAAQWALNAALAPTLGIIAAIIVAIAALAFGVVYLIRNWAEIVDWVKTSDNWFAKLIRGSLRPIVAIFRAIRDAWNSVTSAFKNGGIKSGIIQIGKVILNFLLMPIQKLLELVGRLTGAKFAQTGAANIAAIRDKLVQAESETPIPPTIARDITTSQTASAQESLKREERFEKQQFELFIRKDPEVKTEGDIPQFVPIFVTNTQ